MASIPPGPPPPPAAVSPEAAAGAPMAEQSLIGAPPVTPVQVAVQQARDLLQQLVELLSRLNDTVKQIDPSLVTHIAFMANAGKQLGMGIERAAEKAQGRVEPGPVAQPAEGEPGV